MRNPTPAHDLFSKLLRRHGVGICKFPFRFLVAVRSKQVPSHRREGLIDQAKYDVDFFEVTGINIVAGLTADFEQAWYESHDKIPLSVFLFLDPRFQNESPARNSCRGVGETGG